MALPDLFPKYNLKKLAYHLPLLIIFILLLLHSTIDSNNLYTRTVFSVTKIINRIIENYLTTTNFIQNPSFESTITKDGTIPGWKTFGMVPSNVSSIDGITSLSTLNLVLIPRHSLSQTINFVFPDYSQLNLAFYLKKKNVEAIPIITLTSYHFDRTTTVSTWKLETDLKPGEWQKYTHSFEVFKPSYKTTLQIDLISNNPAAFFDDFHLYWQSKK